MPKHSHPYYAIVLGMPESEAVALVLIPPVGKGQWRPKNIDSTVVAGVTSFVDSPKCVFEDDGTMTYFDAAGNQEGRIRCWQLDDCSLAVVFRRDGKVIGKEMFRNVPRTWWGQLARFLGM